MQGAYLVGEKGRETRTGRQPVMDVLAGMLPLRATGPHVCTQSDWLSLSPGREGTRLFTHQLYESLVGAYFTSPSHWPEQVWWPERAPLGKENTEMWKSGWHAPKWRHGQRECGRAPTACATGPLLFVHITSSMRIYPLVVEKEIKSSGYGMRRIAYKFQLCPFLRDSSARSVFCKTLMRGFRAIIPAVCLSQCLVHSRSSNKY